MDKGHCDQDRTHLVNATMGYEIPRVRQSGLERAGLELAGLGHPHHAVRAVAQHHHGLDNALNGQIGQRPNQVSDDVYGAKTLDSYLNGAAFAAPAPGTSATCSTAASKGRGPGRSTWRCRE